MTEMVGLSRGLRRPSGVFGSLFAALKRGLNRGGSRSTALRLEEWPDYLLRDIGLDRDLREHADPRAARTDWLIR